NAWFVGTYAFTGTVTDPVASSTESFSFMPYPAMESGDQRESLKVEIIGISVPSPDISQWLVVPYATELGDLVTTLVIEDMSYYHAGDVIVASDGELTVLNSEFLLVQDYANERTIYVDGYGVLRFENAVVTSELPIDIIVQGHGTLEVINSEMDGVSIYAREDATILLDGSTMTRGGITTSWNSRATMAVYDCELVAAPILSGSTMGSFTNTSVPAITVEDDAVALIYRWIHVTVWDGNSNPLPGVDVFARFFVNQTFWATAVSDSLGVARLNSLGSILTASGSTFVGNYRVNATYWYDLVAYESDQEVSVGVAPYTEPLGMNATYALLTISSALPDLEINSMTGVTCDPESPLNGEEAIINATVSNTGTSVAYNVGVDFYDDNEMFATVVYSKILPGETVYVLTPWLAGFPLDPESHTIKVIVDQADEVNEMDDSLAVSYCYVTVQNLPDLEILADYGIDSMPLHPVVDSECVISVTVYNGGTNTAYNVPVAFYNASLDLVAPENLIGVAVIDVLTPTSHVDVSVPWTPEIVATHIISVRINENLTIPESDYANNNASFDLQVYDYPDLWLSEFQFASGLSTVAGGDSVTIWATIENLEPAPVTNPVVGLYIDEIVGDPQMITVVLGTFSEGTNVGVAVFTYDAPMVSDDTDILIILVANPDQSYMEQSYANNVVSGTLTVTDVRPDLYIATSDISVTYNDNPVTEAMFGREVVISVDVTNLGSRPVTDVSVEVGIDPPGGIITYSLGTEDIAEIASGATETVNITWLINLTTPDVYSIWADADPNGAIGESNETNNRAAIDFTVVELAVDVTILPELTEYEAGALVITVVFVKYEGEEVAVKNLPEIFVSLYDSSGAQVGTPVGPLTTDADGRVVANIESPETLASGQYTVGVTIQDTPYQSAPVTITGETGGGIPLIIWLIVIAVIVAVVVGFTLYTYKYGLGKLVECGECGAFVPAASKRCPKCGVEFEAGTMKCSECGQWVPSSASECPNCGVKFVGEPEGEDLDYLDRMRTEYDSMVSEYRELSKSQLGKKFSDKRFEEWWKQHPNYVSFEDWLAKEEEKRKDGPVPCTVCGTLNPREATVCHKCGTIFAPAEGVAADEALPEALPEAAALEQPSQAPPRRPPEGGAGGAVAAPKMVVRRPIDRKVVPKKIVRTPVDQDDQGES
ncbi:MAG TPA: CARDB domain-containing protein, partial [Thermoplasmata archaeon]|nr:CARDB domain-containing protein [Thermoplasmata archaeon]